MAVIHTVSDRSCKSQITRLEISHSCYFSLACHLRPLLAIFNIGFISSSNFNISSCLPSSCFDLSLTIRAIEMKLSHTCIYSKTYMIIPG